MNQRGHRGPYLFGLGLAVALLLGLGVGGWGLLGTTIASAAEKPIAAARTLPAGFFTGTLNPRIPDASLSGGAATVASIEIDDRDNDPDTAGVKDEVNANYGHTGTHAATTHNIDTCPVGGSATNDQDCPNTAVDAYGDWNDIAGPADLTPGVRNNHKVVDTIGNSDTSIFSPDSCMADGSALGKQDITEIYLANNNEDFYFGQARRENNGNSQFYWVFSQNEPQATSGICSGGKDRLDMKFSAGDVRVRIGFPSSPNSSQPLVSDLSFHKYTGATTGFIEAADAVNDVLNNPGNWVDTTGTAVENYSLNTSCISAPTSGTNSALGAANKCGAANLVDYVEFAEGAIDLNELLGGTTCGKTLYLTVITRPSESATSDLKDFLGPIKVDFGGVTASASLAPTCSLDITKTGTATDNTGAPIVDDNAFDWTFYKCVGGCDIDSDLNGIPDQVVGTADTEDGTEPNDAVGTYAVGGGAGTYQAVLLVTEASSGCFDNALSNAVQLSPFTVDATATDTCSLSLPYSATQNGSIGTLSCTWTLGGPTATSNCETSGLVGGACDVATPGGLNYSAQIDCTDTRGSLVCPATDTDYADVFGPIIVDIAPTPQDLICPAIDSGTAVTYNATISGGQAPYTKTWTVGGANVAAACGDNVSCLVDFATGDFCGVIDVSISVEDSFGLCPAQGDGPGVVTKTTEVHATNP